MARGGALDRAAWNRENQKLGSGSPCDYPGLTKIEFTKARSPSRTEWIAEVIDWLCEESRPGRWTWMKHDPWREEATHHVIWLSDPNVAFEFKLRWV
jgi:hypothetical protein